MAGMTQLCLAFSIGGGKPIQDEDLLLLCQTMCTVMFAGSVMAGMTLLCLATGISSGKEMHDEELAQTCPLIIVNFLAVTSLLLLGRIDNFGQFEGSLTVN